MFFQPGSPKHRPNSDKQAPTHVIEDLNALPLQAALLHKNFIRALRIRNSEIEAYVCDHGRLLELIDIYYGVFTDQLVDPSSEDTPDGLPDIFSGYNQEDRKYFLTRAAVRTMNVQSPAILSAIASDKELMAHIIAPFLSTPFGDSHFAQLFSDQELPPQALIRPILLSTDLSAGACQLFMTLFVHRCASVTEFLVSDLAGIPAYRHLLDAVAVPQVSELLTSMLIELSGKESAIRSVIEQQLVEGGFCRDLVGAAFTGSSTGNATLTENSVKVIGTLMDENLPIMTGAICAALAPKIPLLVDKLPQWLDQELSLQNKIKREPSGIVVDDAVPGVLAAADTLVGLIVHAALVFARLSAMAVSMRSDYYNYASIEDGAAVFWDQLIAQIPRLVQLSPLDSAAQLPDMSFSETMALAPTTVESSSSGTDSEYSSTQSERSEEQDVQLRPGPLLTAVIDLLTSLISVPSVARGVIEKQVRRFEDLMSSTGAKPLIASPDDYTGRCSLQALTNVLLNDDLGLVAALCRICLAAPFASELHVAVTSFVATCVPALPRRHNSSFSALEPERRTSITVDADEDHDVQECSLTSPRPVHVLRRASMAMAPSSTGTTEFRGSLWDQIRSSGVAGAISSLLEGIESGTISGPYSALQSFILGMAMALDSLLPMGTRCFLDAFLQKQQLIMAQWEALVFHGQSLPFTHTSPTDCSVPSGFIPVSPMITVVGLERTHSGIA